MICPEKAGHIAWQVFGAQAFLGLAPTKPLSVYDTNHPSDNDSGGLVISNDSYHCLG